MRSTIWCDAWKRGPWPEAVLARLSAALDDLTAVWRARPEMAAVVLYGSYARGDFGRKSDVDLLVLLSGPGRAPQHFTREALEAEAAHQLPMHLAVQVAVVGAEDELSPAFRHAVAAEGIVLYGRAAAVACLPPGGLRPWEVIRFDAAAAPRSARVRVSRRLRGRAGRPGLLRPPVVDLAPGALLAPPEAAGPIREALREAGAVVEAVPVWRDA
ncbi:MAG TPA: nucleotidyltransferase domain-containing protein [Chloroflexota bacterium]|jgi:predicted nucleotidyltransferase|nr:nucleotidyltransferase domain-containing protein [Chloroflexota bacterium]